MSSMDNRQLFYCATEEETKEIGRKIGRVVETGTVVSLQGPLGAGKTVIAKGVAESLGITEAIVSPTFTLVQEYEGRLPLYHLDLYRLDGVDDFEGIGGEELLYSQGVTLIEWSEKIEKILPLDTIRISLSIQEDGSREIEVKGVIV